MGDHQPELCRRRAEAGDSTQTSTKARPVGLLLSCRRELRLSLSSPKEMWLQMDEGVQVPLPQNRMLPLPHALTAVVRQMQLSSAQGA
jgi:hypothetical protein